MNILTHLYALKALITEMLSLVVSLDVLIRSLLLLKGQLMPSPTASKSSSDGPLNSECLSML